MTVSSETFRNDYLGNGATSVYPYSFRIFADTEITVITADTTGAETTLALTTDYTVSNAGSANGGNVTLVAGALTSGYTLTITRNVPLTQETDLRNRSTLFAEVLEDQYDRDVMIAQQQQDTLNRSIKIPAGESGTAGTVLPSATVRANKTFVWDASGIPAAGTAVSAFAGALTVIQVVDTIAALKAIPAPVTALCYLVRGYTTAGDGGDGFFRFNTSDATADNGGTVIAPNSGTGRWNRLQSKQSAVNVRWFGAKGDGSTDDTASVAAAQAWAVSTSANAVEWPPGDYRCNVTLTAKIDQRGAGNQKTLVSSYTNNGYAFTLNDRDTSWFFATISDMKIGRDALLQNGVRFGGDTYVANDELTGRWIFDHINFTCDVCVYKQSGNIGNRFESCQFRAQIYGYYAFKRAGGSIMHSGADTFYSCHFQEAAKAAVFINSAVDGSSNTEFFQCVFEANPGFAIFIRNYTGSFAPGVRIDSMFIENNATGGTISVHDGATGLAGATTNYTAQDVYLRNVHQCLVTDTTITKWTLVDSVVRASNCGTSDSLDTVTKDATSVFLFENLTTDATSSNGFYCENVVNAVKIAGNSATHFITKPRHTISNRWAGNIVFSKTFEESMPEVIDGVTFTHVMDGTCYAACGQGTMPDALRHNLPAANFTVPANKYIVWTMDVKLVSGTITELAIYGANVLSAHFGKDGLNALTAGRWYTIGGFCNTVGVIAFLATGQFTFSNGAVFRLGGFQVMSFDNPQDAMEYQRSGIFTPPVTRQRQFTMAAIPITGTHLVGDIVWYTAPASGGPPGAVCTTAGTPGTWKAMGNLA